MPRTHRLHLPHQLVHVIVRFVNERFLITTREARAAYLRRLFKAVRRTDWRLLAWAVMSNHIHLGFLTGRHSLAEWGRSVHTGWTRWMHSFLSRDGCKSRGPLIAERPTTIFLPLERTAYLIAYIHNNPVRANVVQSAELSDWTSHRALIGLEHRPSVLDARLALSLCDLSDDSDGRRVLQEHVTGHADDPRDDAISGRTVAADRAEERRRSGSGAEVRAGAMRSDGTVAVLPSRTPGLHVRAGYPGSALDVLVAVARLERVSVEAMRERLRASGRTRARRIAVLTWHRLGRPMSEMAAALSMSRGNASKIVSGFADDAELAQSVARVIDALLLEPETDERSLAS